MSRFKVGEVAIIAFTSKEFGFLDGTECVITEPAMDNWCDIGEVSYGFKSPLTD